MKRIGKKCTLFLVITAMFLSCMMIQIPAFAASVTPINSDVDGAKLVSNIENGVVIKIAEDLKHSKDTIYYIAKDGTAKKKASADTVGILKISIKGIDNKASYVSSWSYEGKGYVYAMNIKAENGNNLYIYENGETSDTDLDCYETCGSAPHINYIEVVMSLGDISDKSKECEEDTSIVLTGVKYAYIFGYEPTIRTVTDKKGKVVSREVILNMAMDDAVTREQVSAMLMRMIDQVYQTQNVKYPMTDNIAAYEGTWYARGLAYAASKGAFDGMERVDVGPVTRGEVAKLVACGLNLSRTIDTAYTDIDDSIYAPYIRKIAAYGYMKGTSDTTFEPDKIMTRAEFCSLFNNIIGRNEMGLTALDKDGKEYQVTADTYYFSDMNDPTHWAYEICLKATSAYTDDGYVDVETRNANIRNILDQFDAQIDY